MTFSHTSVGRAGTGADFRGRETKPSQTLNEGEQMRCEMLIL